MNNTEMTPPVLRTLFPLKGNEQHVDRLAAVKGTRLFVFDGNILFEGDILSTNEMKCELVGGVTA